MLFLIGSFFAGILTVLAPCVLPLLPIIIGGSVSGNAKDQKRPIIIAVSLALSLFLFTMLLKASTVFINVPPSTFTIISGVIVIGLGIITLFPELYARVINRLGIEQQAQKALGKGFTNKRAYVGPAITGAALGPVFSSCSPVYAYILATVLPANFGQAIAYIIAYILGLSVVLLAIGFYGQRFTQRIKFASNPKGWFQRIVAVLFILVGILILTGYDKQFQAYVGNHTPFNFDKLSSKILPSSSTQTDDADVLNVTNPVQAPEFTGLTDWINSKPLTTKELRGKVVYVDFWTYSCINCIRNNPYIEGWYKQYKDDGFVVVGVHAPEFSFEKVPANVQKAVRDQKITYPVALDNDFSTWNAFQNQSWPAGYLIDAKGNIRRFHAGEGQYTETESAIRKLLTENGTSLSNKMTTSTNSAPVTAAQTPETYLGKSRASNYVGTPALGAAPSNSFTHSQTLGLNKWSLGGNWQVDGEKITALGNSSVRIKIAAKDMYVVADAKNGQKITVLLNGKPISQTGAAGKDINNSAVDISEPKLFRIVSYPQFTSDDEIELQVPTGVSLNAFTFGS